jgi:hypothetical protein
VRGNGNHERSSELKAYKRKFSVNVQKSPKTSIIFLTLQARDIDSNTLGNVVQTDAKSGDKSDTADLTLQNTSVILIKVYYRAIVRVSKYLLLSLCVNNFLRLGRTVVLCGRVLVISFFGLVAFFAIRVCVIGFIVVVAVREEVRCKAEKEHTNKELQ